MADQHSGFPAYLAALHCIAAPLTSPHLTSFHLTLRHIWFVGNHHGAIIMVAFAHLQALCDSLYVSGLSREQQREIVTGTLREMMGQEEAEAARKEAARKEAEASLKVCCVCVCVCTQSVGKVGHITFAVIAECIFVELRSKNARTVRSKRAILI
jgi:hypothetical protein